MYNMCVGKQSEYRTCTSAVRCKTNCLVRGADVFFISLDEDTRVIRRKNRKTYQAIFLCWVQTGWVQVWIQNRYSGIKGKVAYRVCVDSSRAV